MELPPQITRPRPPGMSINMQRREEVICIRHTIAQRWVEDLLRERYETPEDSPFIQINNMNTTSGSVNWNSANSDIIALSVDATINRDRITHQFIVKLLPLDPVFRYHLSNSKFDLREISFYTTIKDDMEQFQNENLLDRNERLALPIARCHFAGYSTPRAEVLFKVYNMSDEPVVLLENLKYCGFSNVDNRRGLNVVQAEAALDSLSRIQAITLCMRVKSGRPLTVDYPYLYDMEDLGSFIACKININLPILSDYLRTRRRTRNIIRKLEALVPDIPYLLETLMTPTEPVAVLTHTDFWANNLMFKEAECVIVDWQAISYGRPTNDAATLLATSLSTKTRRRNIRRLLESYWEHLREYTRRLGLDIEQDLGYSRAELAEDYRRSQVYALLVMIANVEKILGQPECELRLLEFLRDLNKNNLISRNITAFHYMNY